MAHSTPANTTAQTAPETRKIPTLTDIAHSPKPPPSTGRTSPPRKEGPGPVGMPRKTLERLIYKKLHQRLPQLARDLAGDIIRELNSGSGKRNNSD